jgi:hypothetical protein
MKPLLIVTAALLLCSCSAVPVMHTSINGYGYSSAPTSISDPRMRSPQFYMDESDSPPWLRADAPRNNK